MKKRTGDEWKVVLCLALLACGIEWAARTYEQRLSLDIAYLRSLEHATERMEALSEETGTVLVVGNSLARQGVDATLFADGLNRAPDSSVHVEYFYPDSSSVIDWSWGIRRYFMNTDARPDHVIVITGRTHLQDRTSSPERLGAYFVAYDDLWEAFSSGSQEEGGMRMVLGKYSSLFATRDRIRPLVGYRFLPGFTEAWPQLVATGLLSALEDGEDIDWGHAEERTGSVRRLLLTLQEMGSKVTVVTVPMPEPYVLPEDVQSILDAADIPVIDLSELPGINSNDFSDGYHLDDDGSKLFTEALLRSLRP